MHDPNQLLMLVLNSTKQINYSLLVLPYVLYIISSYHNIIVTSGILKLSCGGAKHVPFSPLPYVPLQGRRTPSPLSQPHKRLDPQQGERRSHRHGHGFAQQNTLGLLF